VNFDPTTDWHTDKQTDYLTLLAHCTHRVNITVHTSTVSCQILVSDIWTSSLLTAWWRGIHHNNEDIITGEPFSDIPMQERKGNAWGTNIQLWHLRTLASISHKKLLWFYHSSTIYSPALHVVAPAAGDITSTSSQYNSCIVQHTHQLLCHRTLHYELYTAWVSPSHNILSSTLQISLSTSCLPWEVPPGQWCQPLSLSCNTVCEYITIIRIEECFTLILENSYMHTKWSNQITATRVVTHYSQVDTAQTVQSLWPWCLPLHHCTSLSQYKTGVNNMHNCGKNTELD